MKFHLSTLFIFAINFLGFSQNKNLEYTKSIKLYNLSTYQSSKLTTVDSLITVSYINNSLKILNPTIAFNWKGRKSNYNELELTTISLNKNYDETTVSNTSSSALPSPISGTKVISSMVSIRYEYIFIFLKGSASRVIPSLGCAINPFYEHLKKNPLTTQAFPTTIVNFGSNGFLVPRATYYFSTKCFFDINIPIELFNLNNSASKVSNPQIPIKSQRTSDWNFHLLPEFFSLRLGLGIKI